MAKQSGIFKVEGKLDDVSFYKSKTGFFVRKKSGIDKERLLSDPAFKRTRENLSEFTTIAGASKFLRDAGAVIFHRAYDPTLHNRLTKLMAQVKNHDRTSRRGERQVHVGFGAAEALQLFRGYDFNSRAGMAQVVYAPVTGDVTTGRITIADLKPEEHLNVPKAGTHVQFTAGFLRVDFETGASELVMSEALVLPIDLTASNPRLDAAPPGGQGIGLLLLLVEFYQEVNGVLYELNSGDSNVLSVVDVG